MHPEATLPPLVKSYRKRFEKLLRRPIEWIACLPIYDRSDEETGSHSFFVILADHLTEAAMSGNVYLAYCVTDELSWKHIVRCSSALCVALVI
ncbi:hypothetical protein KOR42_02850 [Thalassoglobus neptunius]|uniref:Uncharacterized protein n=1 Tax=Thalassoglobus neptunius TaxID=1938619 RepID=A0A5C5X2U9_9PLAN|nr:hypothetical protein KOR42_02850 [Thalassoglobus neptunius]